MTGDSAWGTLQRLPRRQWLRVGGSVAYLVLLALLFAQPLARLMRYAAQSALHSYILLTPLTSGYVLYLNRRRTCPAYRASTVGAVVTAGIGAAALAARIFWSTGLSVNDSFGLMSLAFVGLLAAGGFLFLGSRWMRANAFAVAYLVFLAPLPDAAANWLEDASAAASAEVAALYISIWGTPVVRHGTVFELPGIVLRVAQECSGIQSSWMLLMTGLLASHLFLRTASRKILLVAFTIPLGILRNGFRILAIAWLCVNMGPQMIASDIHRHGGPVFFTLSLFPLMLLLWWLRRQEKALQAPG